MNKKLDMSVFEGQQFDIERSLSKGVYLDISPTYNLEYDSYYECDTYQRPRLNHWHFNGGSILLPDGLVVDIRKSNGNIERGVTDDSYVKFRALQFSFRKDYGDPVLMFHNIEAVKILGLTPEYSEEAERLDMPVIDLEGGV